MYSKKDDSNNNQNKRKADVIVEESRANLIRRLSLVANKKVKIWKALLIIVFAAGFATSLAWSISTDKISESQAASAKIKCSDSDGGKIFELKGTCQDNKGKTTDYCVDDKLKPVSESQKVREYYCDSKKDKCAVTTIKCPKEKICKDGACVFPFCESLNGHICMNNEICASTYLNAGDSFRCCSSNCLVKVPNIGEERTLVILAKMSDGYDNLQPTAEIQDLVFNKLNKYLTENSYGKMWISGKIAGPYTIAGGICSIPEYGQQVKEIMQRAVSAADNDIDFRNYDRLIIIHNSLNCSLTHEGGFYTLSTQEGNITLPVVRIVAQMGEFTLYHETGHTLGSKIGHISSLSCKDNNTDYSLLSNSCEKRQLFEDPYDVMGFASHIVHYSAINKEIASWLDKKDIITANEGVYSLTPLESSTTGIKAIKVPMPNMAWEIFLEYRTPESSDSGNPPAGVVAHAREGGMPWIEYFLTDFSKSESILEIGRNYIIADSGIGIKVEKVTAENAMIRITNSKKLTQCNDGIDNDNIIDENGYKDALDYSCMENGLYNPHHPSEVEPFQCEDGMDNDRDGLIDMADPHCESWNDYWEFIQ
ncbi:MAG: hypothetical protein WC659_06775 [Patescibacteria group bacterium]